MLLAVKKVEISREKQGETSRVYKTAYWEFYQVRRAAGPRRLQRKQTIQLVGYQIRAWPGSNIAWSHTTKRGEI